jgi:hypothetical protein
VASGEVAACAFRDYARKIWIAVIFFNETFHSPGHFSGLTARMHGAAESGIGAGVC